jgi:dTDP-4-amino-4,6-dideoxygalactose transaminase
LPEEPEWARSNWQSFCVRLPAGCDQRQTMQALLELGIATRRGIMCAHREPAYAQERWSCGVGPGACGCAAGRCARLAQSESAQDQSIILPVFHEMTDAEQQAVAAAVRKVLTAKA